MDGSPAAHGADMHHKPRPQGRAHWDRRAAGLGIVSKLEDVDHGVLRSRWNNNVLEIGALHPSFKRYSGPKSQQYAGQDQLHFRALLTDVVVETLCARRLQENIESNPRDFEGMSWDHY